MTADTRTEAVEALLREAESQRLAAAYQRLDGDAEMLAELANVVGALLAERDEAIHRYDALRLAISPEGKTTNHRHLVALAAAYRDDSESVDAAEARADAAEARAATADARAQELETQIVALAGKQASEQGSWAASDPRRAFVAGAAWWEFYGSDGGGTMWQADRDKAEAEASRRTEAKP